MTAMLVIAFALGISSGLRTFTALAVLWGLVAVFLIDWTADLATPLRLVVLAGWIIFVLLAAWYWAPVSMFRVCMDALATTAPAGSVTVPVMVPRSLWASARDAAAKKTIVAIVATVIDTRIRRLPVRLRLR